MEESVESIIVRLMKEAYQRNWITSRDGNISFIKDDTMYMTPSGVRKHEMYSEDIIQIPLTDGKYSTKNLNVSIEFKMHQLIQTHMDGGAVIHFHPTNIVAAMLAQVDLEQIHSYFPELNRFTKVGPTVGYIFPGEESLAIETSRNIFENDIVGLLGHGVTSKGKTLLEAFEHIERLDHCCGMALKAGAFRNLK